MTRVDRLDVGMFLYEVLGFPMPQFFGGIYKPFLLLSFSFFLFSPIFCVSSLLRAQDDLLLFLRYDPLFFYLNFISFSCVLMFEYFEVRRLSPYVSFFFARIGASLESSGGGCPQVELFISSDSTLGLFLADLYPLLRQSLDWFQSLREMLVEVGVGSKVRSSELETGLLSSDKPVEVEVDTTVTVPLSSKPSSSKKKSRAFHALKEECTLDEDTLLGLEIDFNFLMRLRFSCPVSVKRSVPLLLAMCVSTRLHSKVALGSSFILL